MTAFTCMLGEPALSAFRKQKILRQIERATQSACSLNARFVYFIESDEPLTPGTTDSLQRLLNAEADAALSEQGLTLVVPRVGTLSPWSTKATDIARRCGLSSVLRIERGIAFHFDGLEESKQQLAANLVHDRMTQSVLGNLAQARQMFDHRAPQPISFVDVLEGGVEALQRADQELGLALSPDEMEYLVVSFSTMQRNPTDAELMMFAQANSEHCRHKIFNASWTIDGEAKEQTLFGMIRNTHKLSPAGVLSAYHDNSAVLSGPVGQRFLREPGSEIYGWVEETLPFQIKVETHNHPTAISPFPGAATGSGGEIRDESATGRGSRPKAGLTGFSVSHLDIPGLEFPWRQSVGKPDRIASPLEIMIEGPIGGASFNNEFGRPALCGYFRTFEQEIDGQLWGYHKPIMIAGGLGTIRESQVDKLPLVENAHVIVLGGPAMLIGLGGGAASSVGSGQSQESLDFASVQRGNPEMQRRCQEVIDACWARGDENPILSIHDVGAGGLSNALPELLDDGGVGGNLDLRRIPSADSAMSPMEIWCNESQERYVLAIADRDLEWFESQCKRERCPFAVLGQATVDKRLYVKDELLGDAPVDMPLEVLLGKAPRMSRDAQRHNFDGGPSAPAGPDLDEALERVLRFPAVGSKSFLVTIGDRSVGGLVCRDQMVGPWQVPVADVAVTLSGFYSKTGEAMAMGERTPLAVVNAPASGRMAIAEAVTNIAAASIEDISRIRLSANWMAAAGEQGQDAALFETVKAVGMELCPSLGIAIPVGKDSLSMKTVWQGGQHEDQVTHRMLAPVSLIISAFAPVTDVSRSLTPQLQQIDEETRLLLVDLGQGRNRMGGSVLAQVYNRFGSQTPDLDTPGKLKSFFNLVQSLNKDGGILAYHDRSDGGLAATVCEMAFASHCGIDLQLDVESEETSAFLFNEEIGAVLQVADEHLDAVLTRIESAGLKDCVHDIGRPVEGFQLSISQQGTEVLNQSLPQLQKMWSETSHAVQRIRDNPACADQELEFVTNWEQSGIHPRLTFNASENPAAPAIASGARPSVAILREQGVNGHVEMAAAFDAAGFSAVDVHMSDLATGRRKLEQFSGFVACGGFSYGDVLGAGRGWANSILFHDDLRDQFQAFLANPARFALGVCNGCQMLSSLKDLVPGAEQWPAFVRNRSEQFEARLSLVKIEPSASLFLQGMEGSLLPVASAHGEGQTDFAGSSVSPGMVSLRYVDGAGEATEHYPENPNGSQAGITGLCNADGRVTIMMPHPERTLRRVNFSWAPEHWGDTSPWQRMFRNARQWVD